MKKCILLTLLLVYQDEGRYLMIENDLKLPGEVAGNMEDYLMLKRLIEGVFNNIGIDNLLQIIEFTLKRPVVIADVGFRIIAESPSISNDIRYHFDYKENVFLDESCIALIRSHYIFPKMREREFSSATILHPDLGSFLTASIKVSDVDILMLIVFENEIAFEQSDYLLIKKICQVMSVEFQKENAFNRYRMAIPNHIISSLLSGKKIPREEFFDKMSHLKWIRAKNFHLMLIEDEAGDKLEPRVSSIVNTLKLYIPSDHCLVYEGKIVCFLTMRIYQDICVSKYAEFENFLKNSSLCSAVSAGYTDIMDSRYYYLTTQNIMTTAMKNRMVFALFPQMKYYILADLLEKQYRICDFCHPAIARLIRFDHTNHTELFPTLKTYLIHKNDLNTVIEKLHIHKSTLFYRIKKIKEITNINLEQIDETAALYFSIKMAELYGEEQFLDFYDGQG